MLGQHTHERSARPDAQVKQRIVLSRIPVEIEDVGHCRIYTWTWPVDLHVLFHGSPQIVHFIEMDVIPPTVSVAFDEQGDLVDAVDDTVTGDILDLRHISELNRSIQANLASVLRP